MKRSFENQHHASTGFAAFEVELRSRLRPELTRQVVLLHDPCATAAESARMNVKRLGLELAWIDRLTAFLATASEEAFPPDGAQPLDGTQSLYTTRSIRPLPARGKSADTPPHGPLGGFDSAQLDCGGRTVLGAIHVNEMDQDPPTAEECPFTQVASPEPISSRPIPVWYGQDLVKDAVDDTVEMEVDHGYGEGKAM